MLSLFNNLNMRVKGIRGFPEWEYVRAGLNLNLENTVDYYRSSAFAVKSSHELIKLLFGLNTSTDEELYTYYKRVDAKALTVGQQLGFTTAMSQGHLFSNVFFKGASKEVIVIVDDMFDPVQVTRNWKDARPIRVLRHGFDQIDCFPLTGRVESSGLSVFAINLPMLAVQYRAFRQWQKTYATEETGRNSIYHFLYAYPLNNMMYDAMDHAVLNRIIKLKSGIETSDNGFSHPFHITNFTMRCDRILSKVIEVLDESTPSITTIGQTIPMVSVDDALTLFKLPDLYESRQINWAMYLARIDILLFLMSFGSMGKQNPNEFNSIKYELRSYLIDNVVRSAVPKELHQKQKALIESILN